MKTKNILLMFGLLLPASVFAMGGDDPVLTKLMVDQLERRDNDAGEQNVLEAQLWIGKDLNKFWLKADVDQFKGKTEEAEVQALYSRAIAPYWDLQMGARRDYRPETELQRNWLVLGFEGLAPYFFEVDTAVFVGENGHSAARLDAEYELMFSQRLVLAPEVTINIAGKEDPELRLGSGLTDIQAGLRLRYEIRREFAPYIGVHWTKKYGQTADYARAAGAETQDTQLVAGLRFWF